MRTPSQRSRRPGVSLTEALIAIFIMTLGLISLLALFPVAALQMAAAFKDERSAQLASNADHLARMIWRNAWLNQANPWTTQGAYISQLAAPERLNDENDQNTGVFVVEPWIQSLDTNSGGATSVGPSAPVFVDPIGYAVQSGNNQSWVAGLNNYVARQTLGITFLPQNPQPNMPSNQDPSKITIQSRIRMTTLLDDISFDPSGSGLNSSTGQVERGGRYNCAWLFQRLRNNVRTEVNVHVVVYQNRPPTDVPATEQYYQLAGGASLPASATSLTIDTTSGSGVPPKLRSGYWIMLAGQLTNNNGTSANLAEFCRVVSVSQPQANQLQLELQTPTRNLSSYTPNVFVLDGVAEVFDRGTISVWEPTAP